MTKNFLIAWLVATSVFGETKVRNSITQGAPINAWDKGVKCDGTDEHVALQVALTAVAGGGTLRFPGLPTGGRVTCNMGTTGLTLAQNAIGTTIECDSPNTVVFSYSGTGTALTVGTTAADTGQFVLRNCGIDLGGASAGANALKTIRVTGGTIERVTVTGTVGATTLGTGIILDGTNSYSGSIAFKRVSVTGNYATGIDCLGAAGINTCNHHTFDTVTIARSTAKPGTGTIGFKWGVNAGDGGLEFPDVEGYDVAYQINGRFLHGFLRCENNTVCVAFGATAFNNFLFVQPFSNTTLATYAGGQAFNSLIDTIQLQMNMFNGQISYNHNVDSSSFFDYQAGSAADQIIMQRYDDRLGNTQMRFWKSAGNFILLDDGSTSRFKFAGGSQTNDTTFIGSPGTGQIRLNYESGTGGTCFGDGASTCKATIDSAGRVAPGAFTNATLGTPANGVAVYCSDCTIANPCAGGGTGAIAKRLNGVWICN